MAKEALGGEGGGGKRRWEALKAFAGENWTKKQNEVEGPHCCELPWTTEQFQ